MHLFDREGKKGKGGGNGRNCKRGEEDWCKLRQENSERVTKEEKNEGRKF
jgi:hypothetical protein